MDRYFAYFLTTAALVLSFHVFLSFSWSIIWIHILTFRSPLIEELIR